jgi:hypothetical protein
MPFNAFAEYPMLTIFVMALVVMMLVGVISPKRPGALPPRLRPRKVCGSCGTQHPDYAAFCRHCGRPLVG